MNLLSIFANSPNPFSPSTTIDYEVPRAGGVRLGVYNPQGRLVRSLIDQSMSIGRYQVHWDGRDMNDRELPCGVYMARLQVGDRVEVRRMTLTQ